MLINWAVMLVSCLLSNYNTNVKSIEFNNTINPTLNINKGSVDIGKPLRVQKASNQVNITNLFNAREMYFGESKSKI